VPGGAPGYFSVQPRVHPVDVGGVDLPLQRRQPLALRPHHVRRCHLLRRQRVHLKRRKQQRRPRPHVGPDHAVYVHARVGLGPHRGLEGALLRLVGHVHAAAADVKLPAVVETQRSLHCSFRPQYSEAPPVWAVLLQEPTRPSLSRKAMRFSPNSHTRTDRFQEGAAGVGGIQGSSEGGFDVFRLQRMPIDRGRRCGSAGPAAVSPPTFRRRPPRPNAIERRALLARHVPRYGAAARARRAYGETCR